MIKLISLLREGTFEKGCVMLFLDISQINKIQDGIDPDDLYEEEGDRTFGLEDQPHITLLYGLDETVSSGDVKKIINKYTFSSCKLTNISCFEKPGYDVLKIDVDNELLHKVHDDLNQLPNEDEFPNYHPHVTIAYVKKGLGKKYIKSFQNVTEFFIIPSYATYSNPTEGKEYNFQIKIK